MKNNSIKEIVKEIKKLATPFIRRHTPANENTKYSPTNYSKFSNTNIMAMQHELQALGSLLSKYPGFINFLNKNYQTKVAVDLLEDVAKQPATVFVDGKWGNNTTKNLAAAYTLIYSLLDFVDNLNQLNVALTIDFSDNDLKSLQSLIDTNIKSENNINNKTPGQKDELASTGSQLLKLIQSSLAQLTVQLNKNPKLNTFMYDNDKPYQQIKNNVPDQNNKIQYMIDGKGILLNDLTDLASLQKWIKDNQVSLTPEQVINKLETDNKLLDTTPGY